jgi:hypothetical protein
MNARLAAVAALGKSEVRTMFAEIEAATVGAWGRKRLP